jgi:HSP20 family molecular chaperone IbpA
MSYQQKEHRQGKKKPIAPAATQFSAGGEQTGNDVEIRTPRVDIYENHSTYYIRVSLPGVRKEV